jgi:hypothetical protein
MEGRPFVGAGATARDVVIAARDRMDAPPGFGRSARDARFRYSRNFLPWLDGDDLPDYATGVAITHELVTWILGYGGSVNIEGPPDLRASVLAAHEAAVTRLRAGA